MAAFPSDSRRLEGKVAIITGGASGLGEAAARLFVENGAMVLIADIQDEKGRRLVQELGEEAAAYEHCDVRVEKEMEAAISAAVRKWGKLDVMMSNAGILEARGTGREEMISVEKMDMEGFERVMGVNVTGAAMAVKHAAKEMVRMGNRKGSIICTGSVAGMVGGRAPVDYTVSKHAIIGLVRAAASDLGKYGIRVNCLSPGSVLTPLTLNYARHVFGQPDLPVDRIQSYIDSVSVLSHHSLSPPDVAHAALYLASDDSSFVSGHNLVIDGALTATSIPVARLPH